MGDNTETDDHLSIHTGDNPENVSPVDADFSDVEGDEDEDKDDPQIGWKHDESEPQVVVRMRDSDPFMEVFGYDTDSDDEAHLCCSECGERVDFVVEKPAEDRDESELHFWTPEVNILGAVCGCHETPEKWTAGGL